MPRQRKVKLEPVSVTLTFVALREEHVPGVLLLNKAAFKPSGRPTRGQLADMMSRPGAAVVAVDPSDGEVFGYAILRENGSRLTLLAIVVDPKNRRKGIGTSLLRCVESSPDLADKSWIDVHVPDTEFVAHAFLRSCGFRAVEVVKRWQNQDCYRFVRFIGGGVDDLASTTRCPVRSTKRRPDARATVVRVE